MGKLQQLICKSLGYGSLSCQVHRSSVNTVLAPPAIP